MVYLTLPNTSSRSKIDVIPLRASAASQTSVENARVESRGIEVTSVEIYLWNSTAFFTHHRVAAALLRIRIALHASAPQEQKDMHKMAVVKRDLVIQREVSSEMMCQAFALLPAIFK